METQPMISDAIARTQKKIGMTLDDIIKMSKNDTKAKKQRVSNRNQKFVNKAAQDKNLKSRRFMDTRSYLRQGALAQRRSTFQENQVPLTTAAAKKVFIAPIQSRPVNQSRPFYLNKPRVRTQFAQKFPANNRPGFTVKKPLQQACAGAPTPMQKPLTLDSRFGNMMEQRMTPHQNNAPRRNAGRPRAPWLRNFLK